MSEDGKGKVEQRGKSACVSDRNELKKDGRKQTKKDDASLSWIDRYINAATEIKELIIITTKRKDELRTSPWVTTEQPKLLKQPFRK